MTHQEKMRKEILDFLTIAESMIISGYVYPKSKSEIVDFFLAKMAEDRAELVWRVEEIEKSPEYINLTTEQGQLDEDGIAIAVSRQALDEVLKTFKLLRKEMQNAQPSSYPTTSDISMFMKELGFKWSNDAQIY